MPTKIEPLDPSVTLPKKDTAPDVTVHVKKINDRLAPTWQPNEIRCGRGYIMPRETQPAVIEEIIKIFVGQKWQVVPSPERRGIVLTFKQPEKEEGDGRPTE